MLDPSLLEWTIACIDACIKGAECAMEAFELGLLCLANELNITAEVVEVPNGGFNVAENSTAVVLDVIAPACTLPSALVSVNNNQGCVSKRLTSLATM
eukprot:1137191-Pelagomonas_calceolata.AAC.11